MVWKNLLKELIGEEACNYEVVDVARSGASGPRVIIVRNQGSGNEYAVKYGDTRVPIPQQLRSREMLGPLFGEHHLPPVVFAGERIMVMEAIDGKTLHEAAVEGVYDAGYLQGVYHRILRRFGEVWEKTKVPFDGNTTLRRNPETRARAIVAMLYRRAYGGLTMGQLAENLVVINGVATLPLKELLESFVDFYETPAWVITCHGDPNADNILINGHRGWWLVDWEWAGLHDWRLVASHLIGWWISNASMMSAKPSVVLSQDAINVNYDMLIPPTIQAIINQAWEFVREVGTRFGEANWERQVKLQVAALLLGDVRFLEARNRTQHAIPLLGEGLRIISELINGSNARGN